METIAKVVLKQNEEKRLLAGHLWVFSNEILDIQGTIAPGDVAGLYSANGKFLAKGYYNPKSLIAFRVLSRFNEEINTDFFVKKITGALNYRKELYPSLNSFRLIFGESDELPGLVADRYENYLSVQLVSLGMEKLREVIIDSLVKTLKPAGIIFRNDSHLRELEGLELKKEIVYGQMPAEPLIIEENGFKFNVNLAEGQKTGHFFDQRDNRLLFSKYCKDKNILDLFCHTGAFGIYAAGTASTGAKKVVCVDSSMPALEAADKNAVLNGLEQKIEFIQADALEYLEHVLKSGFKYDVIMLDPPALIKNKKSFHAGVRLYSKLNTAAMNCLKSDGILASSSCSHHLSPGDFRQMLKNAAAESELSFKLLELKSQSLDHPVLISMPETEYLKFAVLKAS